jgi:hypothetical protein
VAQEGGKDRRSSCHNAVDPKHDSSNNPAMTEKEIVLETIRALPDDCSLEEIAERIEFMAAVRKGLDQLDRGEGIPHDEVKRQLASWLTN